MSKAKHMECPDCGQEINSDDFVFDEEDGTGNCIRVPTPRVLTPLVLGDWKCEMFEGVFYHPIKDNEPNWFHRWMTKVFFGWKWERKEG